METAGCGRDSTMAEKEIRRTVDQMVYAIEQADAARSPRMRWSLWSHHHRHIVTIHGGLVARQGKRAIACFWKERYTDLAGEIATAIKTLLST
eukprot:scaffold894_cov153-Cylindrotheca_fusiformis.AAC.8